MATLNYGTRQLDCKIVYYGPALGGKTTNLQHIHRILPAEACGELTNLATKQDRTLYFDLLPVSLGRIGGYYVKVHLYTVPGQVYYNATRRVVLSGVDGVVMVFDSDPAREGANYQSLANLEENLASYGLTAESVPMVFQFNKRDLPNAMDVDFMSKSLNPEGRYQEFEAVAVNGDGVQETLKSICSLVFARIEDEAPRRPVLGAATRTLRPRDTHPPAPAASSEPEPEIQPLAVQRPAPMIPHLEARPPSRTRQLSDLRLTGLRIGHAVVDLVPVPPRKDAPDYAATVEIRPAVGNTRLEKMRYWRITPPCEGESVERYESRPLAGEKPSRMWRLLREGRPPEVYLDWPTLLGQLQIVPEGRRRMPVETVGGN